MLALSPPEDPAFPCSQREPTKGATSWRPSRRTAHWDDDPEKEHNMNFVMAWRQQAIATNYRQLQHHGNLQGQLCGLPQGFQEEGRSW
jgi:hypothetical protein